MTTKREGSGSAEMAKAYDPAAVEGRIYRMWEDGDYFKPRDGDGDPFTIVMPPPNLTGELHLGHALTDAVQDILIRWHRMRGDPSLWLPGIDHAAIAVHTLVERQLASEGLTRFDIGRERFLERVWEFVNTSRTRIFDQHKRLGVSADWSRELFTMDPGPAKAVRTAFYRFYEKGLIYRGERMINWCPGCQTAVSDLEVAHEDRQGHLWHVRYPLLDDDGKPTEEYITIATTRPETIVADTGIAVNPGDERYKAIVGRKALLPIIERELPIVGDEAIDPAFGTGALKVTPGHDVTDFEIGQRTGLPTVTAIAKDGSMNAEAGPYDGTDRFACREAIVRDLDEQGFLVKTEDYTHSVGQCDRCNTVIEPLISEQWFVAVNKEYAPGRSLAGEALQVVNDGSITFLPPRFTKIYTNWMENIRDWCISRQLWWGHPIPVWYCDGCDATIVPPPEVETPQRCDQCDGTELRQDEDTLDTWFSSGLWPASTLGWPDDTDDLKRFYPTNVMETAYEIIFFWVARMIMMCTFALDDRRDDIQRRIPFRYVYLHGLVRDDQGQKMSKSRGNVVDPIGLVDRYGADALRFNVVTAAGTGQDQRLREEKVEAARNFANKLWNVSRFVIMQLDEADATGLAPPVPSNEMPAEDRWILSRLDRVVCEVDRQLHDFQLNEAGHRMYDFLWNEYCDWYVEMAKVRLRAKPEGQASAWHDPLPVLAHVLETGLRLLHPYMPFVTEELWQRLRPYVAGAGVEALMVAPFPQARPVWRDEHAEHDVEVLQEVVRAIRDARHVDQVSASQQLSNVKVELAPALRFAERAASALAGSSPPKSDEDKLGVELLDWQTRHPERIREILTSRAPIIQKLGGVRQLEVLDLVDDLDKDEWLSQNAGPVNVFVKTGGYVDRDAQRARLTKEIEEVETYLKRLDGKLSNEQFRSKAPRDVVAAEEQRHADANTRLEGLRRALDELG